MPNPFIPFQIATSEQFINRAAEVKTILERVAKGASTGIVGNPHIGKSSLLRRVNDPTVIAQFVPNSERYIFVELDFQSFQSDHTPNDFWRHVLREITFSADQDLKERIRVLMKPKTLDVQGLLSTFNHLANAGQRVVLLVDEFDYLFNLPHFNTLDFLGPLRVVVMKSRGLVLVTASRLSVAELNVQAEKLKDKVRGSDLLNYLEPVFVGSFGSEVVLDWLKRDMPNSSAIETIITLAGHHPLLLQLAGELYYEADLTNELTRRRLGIQFIEKADTQFQDVWNYLNPKAQVALVILALDELNNRLSSGEKFSLEQRDKYLVWYDSEVKQMVRQGTLEISATGGERIGSQAFLHWIFDHKIVGTRGEQIEDFTQWLTNKEYKLGGLLTQEEINWLQKVWQKIPDGLIDLAHKIILPKALQ
ncbi:MAG: hypothetical protein DPW09_42530 [Anaerolineae bacterium]|nr:hypothetical protein [Anaerolineae bacterium]